MTAKVNYQKELDKILSEIEHRRGEQGFKAPRLLLHCCCAPCSSYVLLYLRDYFRITVYFYNPNITEPTEYIHRKEELKRFIGEINGGDKRGHQSGSENFFEGSEQRPGDVIIPPYRIEAIDADYDPDRFFDCAKGLETCPEGGERCKKCFELRLDSTAERASEGSFDYFCTTLTISPLKDAGLLNEVGADMAKRYGVSFLPSDFKKKNGYRESVLLSQKYELYRQDYCGCVFSKRKDLSL